MLTHIVLAIALICLMVFVIYESHKKQTFKNRRVRAVEQGKNPDDIVKPKLVFDYFI